MAYIAAYIVILLIPGPGIFMVIGQFLPRGLCPAMLCVIGDVVGGGGCDGDSYALQAAFAGQKFQNLRARKAIGYAGGLFMLGGGAFVVAIR